MPRTLPSRRIPRHHPAPHRLPRHRAHGSYGQSARTSDLILAVLGVALLGGLALSAAFALTASLNAP